MQDDHVDAGTLAEHAEGLLDAATSGRVAAHLDRCATCRGTAEQVAAVTMRLSEAPASVPMPASVAARIDAAIERAVDEGDAAPEATAGRPVRRWLPRALLAAGAIAAIALAGSAVLPDRFGSSSTEDSATAGLAEERAAGRESAPEDTDQSADAGGAALPVPAESSIPGGGVAADGAPKGEAATAPIDRKALSEEITALVADAQRPQSGLTAACGTSVAAELGRPVIASAPTDLIGTGAVLVVVEGPQPDTVQGWVVPTCEATTGDALAEAVVPTE